VQQGRLAKAGWDLSYQTLRTKIITSEMLWIHRRS
jgi:hypothetical protein